MKKWKIGSIIILLFIFSMLAWFLYPRLFLPRYIIDGNKMTCKNNVYAARDYAGEDDIYLHAKTIGIAICKDSKTKLSDFIFVEWVKEYEDKNSICIRTEMGPVEVYDKASK